MMNPCNKLASNVSRHRRPRPRRLSFSGFSGRLVITFDVVIDIRSSNAIEYILFAFKNLQYLY